MKKYKLTHEQLEEIFRRWSAMVIARPKKYEDAALPSNAGATANEFAKWYEIIKSE